MAFGNELEGGRDPQSRAPNAQTPDVQQAQGIGVARLRIMMVGGIAQPDAVVKLLAEYPREHDAIIGACMTTLGNGFVQQVIKAAQQQQQQAKPATAPAPQAPQPQDPHVADEAAKQKAKESVAELNATTYASLLLAAKDDTDSKQGRWKFLNILDRCDDPLTRQKMGEKFRELTGQTLDAFIKAADWGGKRDQQQALAMISADRGAAETKLEKMSPQARKELAAKANAWAEQVLAVTRTKDADDDDQAVKIARVLGPRSPEEIEMIRAAIRKNTNGEHTMYEELDKSLSKGNEDEAVAGLGGDPVRSAIVGISNAGKDAERIKEILKGLNPRQLTDANNRQAMFGPAWAASDVPAGPDHDEIVKLLAGDKAGAEAVHITNLLKEPAEGFQPTMDFNKVEAQAKTAKLRSTDNVLAELESKSPDEINAAREAWNKEAKATGGKTWEQMIEDRFGHEDVDAARVKALASGNRAEDKVLALREGMQKNDQKEIEAALANPDLKSADPATRAKAQAERAKIEQTAKDYDAGQQRAQAFFTGGDVTKVQGRSIDAQLDQHYKDYVATDEHSSNLFDEMRHQANRDGEREDRAKAAHDQQIASTELSQAGQLSTATQYKRADTKDRANLLDGEQSNKQLAADEADYKNKYGTSMLGQGGDRDDMDANELKIDNVRQFGVASERRADTQLRLQQEQLDKQHSDSLANDEMMRQLRGGNAGTEDLVREQLAVEDSMLTPGYGPFGIGRELKQGIGKDEFGQIDQNVTKSLETQREEKSKLSEHVAHIFSTIAKIGALLAMQPELFALIDVCSGLAEIAIKKSIAGEAYDPADDAKMLAIDAAVDLAMVGVSKLAEARKLGAAGKEAVTGERAAAKALAASTEGDVKAAVAEAKADALAAGKTESRAVPEAEASATETKSPAGLEDSQKASKEIKGAKLTEQEHAAAVKAQHAEGFADSALSNAGMQELIPGTLWSGSEPQVRELIEQARESGIAASATRDVEGGKWHVKVGDKEVVIEERSPVKNLAAENRGEPYSDPRADPDRPHQHIPDRELLPVRKMDHVESWKKAVKALKKGPVAVGKPLKSAADGHALLADLAAGNSEALTRLGVTDIPAGFDPSTREWALVQGRDGFAIYAGAHDSVTLPADVRVLAHNHPSPLVEGPSAGRIIDLPPGLDGKPYAEILNDTDVAGKAGITPSAKDIHAISDGGEHTIYTRYMHDGDGMISNPSGDGSRVNIHLSDTKVRLKNVRQGRYWYETAMTVRDSKGGVIWEGTAYTEWNVYGSNGRVQFSRPAVFDRPPQQTGFEAVP